MRKWAKITAPRNGTMYRNNPSISHQSTVWGFFPIGNKTKCVCKKDGVKRTWKMSFDLHKPNADVFSLFFHEPIEINMREKLKYPINSKRKHCRRHTYTEGKIVDEKRKDKRHGTVSEYLIMEKGNAAPFWLAYTFTRYEKKKQVNTERFKIPNKWV